MKRKLLTFTVNPAISLKGGNWQNAAGTHISDVPFNGGDPIAAATLAGGSAYAATLASLFKAAFGGLWGCSYDTTNALFVVSATIDMDETYVQPGYTLAGRHNIGYSQFSGAWSDQTATILDSSTAPTDPAVAVLSYKTALSSALNSRV